MWLLMVNLLLKLLFACFSFFVYMFVGLLLSLIFVWVVGMNGV